MRNELHVYAISPIDIWVGWTPFLQFLLNTDGSKIPYGKNGLFDRLCHALKIASSMGWEGDFSNGPFISAIPADDGENIPDLLFAWKQSNNGTTFIVSPYALPWMSNAKHRVEQTS
jgi:hypothetical protein